MAIGDKYTTIPGGFVEHAYNFKDPLIKFTSMASDRTTWRYGSSTTSGFVFYTKNITDLRFINFLESGCSVQYIYVNDVKLEDKFYYSSFAKHPVSTLRNKSGHNVLVEELFLTKKYNKIEIKGRNTTLAGGTQVNYERLQFNKGGEIITEDEYLASTSISFLLKIKDIYYTYNELNNTLDEIDKDNIDKFSLTEVEIGFLSNALKLVPSYPSLKDVKLILSKGSSATISGIKSTQEMLVMKDNTYLNGLSVLNNVRATYSVNGENNSLKLAVSTDNGLTWKTYKDEEWQTLNIIIPQNNYNDLSSRDRELWDNAKLNIVENGIDCGILDTIDFNILEALRLKFAIVITNSDAHANQVYIKDIIFNARPQDYYVECGTDEVTRMVMGDYLVRIKSNIESEEMIVNINTVGITSGGIDYRLATYKPIFNGKEFVGDHDSEYYNVVSKDEFDKLAAVVNGITGGGVHYKGFYATEDDMKNILNPQENDYAVVATSINENPLYNGKTLRYTYLYGKWQISLIMDAGTFNIDDANISKENTWSSDHINTLLESKEDIHKTVSFIIDESQFIKETEGEYKDFYKVSITHDLGCGKQFNTLITNQNNQKFGLGCFFDNIELNSFDLYTISKQTLEIQIKEA